MTHYALCCAIVFLIAFGVRLLHWQDIRSERLYGETMITKLVDHYLYEAREMIEERGIVFPSVPVDPGNAHRVMHPPGYSALLLALYGKATPDRSYSALRLIQICFDAVAVVLVLLIAAELLPLGAATIAGLLAAFSPHLSYYSLWLTPDSLTALPILLAVLLIIKASRKPRLLLILAAGALLGLSCWLRSNGLLLAPFIALTFPFLFGRGNRLLYSLALVLAMMAVIAPITVRNWVVYRQFIPLTIATGINLVQGIAEYDSEERFGMPVGDKEVLDKDVEWHSRPDYAADTWSPDGIERDRARFARGLAVIRDNPGWFAGVMLRRMEFMLRYNDFRPTTRPFYTSRAPVVLDAPIFGHSVSPASEIQPVLALSTAELISDGTTLSRNAKVELADEGRRLQVSGDDSASEDQFSSPYFAVEPNTDYVLKLEVALLRGPASIEIKGADPRITMALVNIPKRRDRKRAAKEGEGGGPDLHDLEIPFASGGRRQARIVVSNDGPPSARPVVQLGRAALFRLGQTPYLWTRYPREAVRAIQKNVYKTNTLRALIVAGIALLALAGLTRSVILLAVPAYYLTSHAAFSTETRYILGMHYFLFMLAATAIYVAGAVLVRLTSRGRGAADSRRERSLDTCDS